MASVLAAMKALIVRDSRILVVRQQVQDREFWDLPGGRVKHGETPYETLVREVKEEVGLDVEVHESVGVWWFYRLIDGDQVICTTFRCSAATADIDLSGNEPEEHIVEHRWVTPDEFLTLPVANESLKIMIRSVRVSS